MDDSAAFFPLTNAGLALPGLICGVKYTSS